jgi:hypothetical protein
LSPSLSVPSATAASRGIATGTLVTRHDQVRNCFGPGRNVVVGDWSDFAGRSLFRQRVFLVLDVFFVVVVRVFHHRTRFARRTATTATASSATTAARLFLFLVVIVFADGFRLYRFFVGKFVIRETSGLIVGIDIVFGGGLHGLAAATATAAATAAAGTILVLTVFRSRRRLFARFHIRNFFQILVQRQFFIIEVEQFTREFIDFARRTTFGSRGGSSFASRTSAISPTAWRTFFATGFLARGRRFGGCRSAGGVVFHRTRATTFGTFGSRTAALGAIASFAAVTTLAATLARSAISSASLGATTAIAAVAGASGRVFRTTDRRRFCPFGGFRIVPVPAIERIPEIVPFALVFRFLGFDLGRFAPLGFAFLFDPFLLDARCGGRTCGLTGSRNRDNLGRQVIERIERQIGLVFDTRGFRGRGRCYLRDRLRSRGHDRLGIGEFDVVVVSKRHAKQIGGEFAPAIVIFARLGRAKPVHREPSFR